MWVYCNGSTPISYTIPQFLYQQDGTEPHIHHDVRGYLSDTLPHVWIGRASQDDSPLLPWPPRPPDLTPCDFLLQGYVKDHVFVPPMPLDLVELRQRIEHAVAGIDHQMLLVRVWQELDYRIDVCRVTNGGHNGTPVKYVSKLWEILYPLAQIFPPCLPWLQIYRLMKSRRAFWLVLY